LSSVGRAAFVAVLVSLGTARASASESLADLVAYTLEQNVDIEALRAQVDALEHEEVRAGAWKDPLMTIGYQNVPATSLSLGDDPMSMLAARIGQEIPFFGKTRRRKRVARFATEAARWKTEEKALQIGALVKRLYYELGLTRQLRAITAEHVGLIERLLDAVRIKYEVGQADQHDVLRLEVLRDRLKDDLNDYIAEDRQLTALMNQTLHREAMTSIATPEEFEIPDLSHSVDSLRRIAIESRPALSQLDAVVGQHEAAADLARYETIPDPTVFVQYGARSRLDNRLAGDDLITVGLSWRLPVFYRARNRASAESAAAKALSAKARKAALLDEIGSGLEHALAGWERAAQKIETYRDHLVPNAHRVLDATFTSYQVDRADFLSLFEAELDLLNFEKALRITAVDLLVAQARVESIIGKDSP
ncbi:MAG: hypothetical protein CME06_06305, partial [Gemmatimonadetes bacterium]|nr:hypothetical protein [Gemmatimonadota bacterium]